MLEGGMEAFINWWSYTFWWTGEVVCSSTQLCMSIFTDISQATIFMSLLIGASFYWIRRQHYELFLVVHIVMSIIVLITMLG